MGVDNLISEIFFPLPVPNTFQIFLSNILVAVFLIHCFIFCYRWYVTWFTRKKFTFAYSTKSQSCSKGKTGCFLNVVCSGALFALKFQKTSFLESKPFFVHSCVKFDPLCFVFIFISSGI